MTKEKLINYAIRGAKSELSDVKAKIEAVKALEPGMAAVSSAEKERMVRALMADSGRIMEDLHELENPRVDCSIT